MHKVALPDLPPDWPSSLDLELGLDEVLLLEGVRWGEVTAFWQVAATLEKPLDGEVLHWGQSWGSLPRPELFRLRKQIAYIAPGQVLLQHLSLRENIALAISYYQGITISQALAEQGELLDSLNLRFFLDRLPAQLPPDMYWRGIWARELAKGPELVLACLDGPGWSGENQIVLQEMLETYLARNQGAFLLAGPNLGAFYSGAHRLLQPAAGGFTETILLRGRDTSPVTFFPLV